MTQSKPKTSDVYAALAWLKSLADMCDDLVLFAGAVSPSADPEEFVDPPIAWLRGLNLHTLASAADPASSVRTYRHDIPGGVCRPAILYVHDKACLAFKAIAEHKALGKFRPDRPPLFYEKALAVCMSVAVQHIDNVPLIQRCGHTIGGAKGMWQACDSSQGEFMCRLLGIGADEHAHDAQG